MINEDQMDPLVLQKCKELKNKEHKRTLYRFLKGGMRFFHYKKH